MTVIPYLVASSLAQSLAALGRLHLVGDVERELDFSCLPTDENLLVSQSTVCVFCGFQCPALVFMLFIS